MYLQSRIWVYGGRDGNVDVWRSTVPAPPDGPADSVTGASGNKYYLYYKP